jgi:YHS domain-containing protein/thiol-disulfide isomerase/thioredoxin
MALRTLLAAGFLFACSALAATVSQAADDQLPWAEDFATACQQANYQGKLVLLHFYSDDCPPCVRVEKNVFSQPEVGAAVGRSYVPVKVHARKMPALVERYRVQQWPTDVFVTPAGLEITRSVSPQSPTDYVSMVNSVAATAGVSIAKANTKAAASATIAQVSNQANSQYNYLTSTATTSAQQFQQSAAQAQQSAQQAANQSWNYAQQQTNQAVANTQQAAQQGYAAGTQVVAAGAQTAQQQTQVAADAAKEVLNQFTPPFQQPAAGGPPAWQSPFAAGSTPATPEIQAAPSAVATVQQQYPANFAPPQQPQQQPFAAAPAAAAPPTAAPAGAYPIAMEGYCPVTLAVERKWKKGQPQFGAVHRRRTFLFTSEAEQQKFLADPDRYSPVMVGYDPVKFMQTGELVDGRATFSLTYRKQVYLFTDDNSLKSFWQNPSQFTEGLRQAMTRAEVRTIR